jgi:hypothetical protein
LGRSENIQNHVRPKNNPTIKGEKMTNFKNDDDYEDMASTFQIMMINWLNLSLDKAGITSKSKRFEICQDFCFMFSIWKDQYWFKDSSGNKVYPCIAFASNGPAADMDIDKLGTVHFPSRHFSFKEYLSGNMHYYYEEHGEEISEQIETGLR